MTYAFPLHPLKRRRRRRHGARLPFHRLLILNAAALPRPFSPSPLPLHPPPPPSLPLPPLSLSSIELLTKEMIRIKQNKIKKEYKTGLTMAIPPSIAAPHLLRWSPRPRLLLSHRLFRRNGLPSSAAAPAYLSVCSSE